MRIENISDRTINQVSALENRIEGTHAASLSTLIDRKKMFTDGFLVALDDDGKVIGYLESCLWDRTDFSHEVQDFNKYHNPEAKTLYVIFLGTNPDYRNKGIASKLMRSVQDIVMKNGKEKIVLVARDELISFYTKLGFKICKSLPNFLSFASCTLMEWTPEKGNET